LRCIRAFEFDPKAWPVRIRRQASIGTRPGRTIEEHVFDALVVVEVLHIA
jgi:hypothetical protein